MRENKTGNDKVLHGYGNFGDSSGEVKKVDCNCKICSLGIVNYSNKEQKIMFGDDPHELLHGT